MIWKPKWTDRSAPANGATLETAKQCRSIYLREINGAGIACQFDRGFDNFPEVIPSAVDVHVRNPVGLDQSIAAFAVYAAGLRAFDSIEVVDEVPDILGIEPASRQITRSLKPELFDTYKEFGAALADYRGVIEKVYRGRAPQDDAIGAAMDLCKVSRPADWDPNIRLMDPESYGNPVRDTSPKWFLEAYLRQEESK